MSGSQWRQRLHELGDARAISGNEPIALDRDDNAWLIDEGKVEVFAIARHDKRRTHVATVAAGEMIFGLGAAETALPFGRAAEARERSSDLMAVAVRDARLVRLPIADLREVARDDEHVERLAARIEIWVDRLISGLVAGPPPKVFQALEAGEEVRLEEAGAAARPRDRVAWVRHLEGRSGYLGEPDLEMAPAAYLLPVSGAAWMTSLEPVRVSCVPTATLVRSGTVWEGLERFHELVLDLVEQVLSRLEDSDRKRLVERRERDLKLMDAAAGRLASVLVPAARRGTTSEASGDPLVRACRLIGDQLGVEVVEPPESARAARRSHHLNRICAASRLRYRQIILRDDWWRRDNGPLVGFRLGEKDPRAFGPPIALLPTSPGSYDLVDPVDGSRTPIDEALAEQLHGVGFMLYAPLPERSLGVRDLLGFALRGTRSDLGTIAAVGAAGGILATLIPIVTAQIFGRIIPGADRSQLGHMIAALVVASLASAGFQITRAVALLRIEGRMDGSLQAAVWDRLLRLPVSFFRRFPVGDMAARSMGIDRIRELLTGNVTTSILAVVFSVFSFGLLFYYNWRLALLATGLVLFVTLVTGLLVWLQLRYQRTLLEMQGQLAAMLFGLMSGIAKLRVAGAESRAYARWASRFADQRATTVRVRELANIQTVFNAVYGVGSSMALYAFMGFKLQELLALNEFLAFFAAFGQFQGAMLATVGVLSSVLTMVPLYERIQPVLETIPEADETKTEAGELAGDIEFSHISFRYHPDGPLILDDVSFRARPGEFIALVGPSGSGKSTCLRLLLGFEQPESGSIYFDGMDLPSLDVQSVRRQIGVVLQGGEPMAGDLFTNIVGGANLTLDDAWQAAKMAGLADDIKAMPMGMHTVVSEGAGTFSGGQKQRLLIARAIVHRPRIVLFDEATSALDNRTQEIVSQSLERLKATRVVIAHRLSTILHADRIFVIEKGRVVEDGTYEELVERGGLFADLVERQKA